MNKQTLLATTDFIDVYAEPVDSKLEVVNVLWVDLMVDSSESDMVERLGEVFNVRCNAKVDDEGGYPNFIFFEYDYPDCDSLRVLKETSERYPEIPIVMVTLQHSEELAVWALRNRVWDYYSKPLSEEAINSLSREMTEYCKTKKPFMGQGCNRRKSTSVNSSYPNEVRFKNNSAAPVVDLAVNYIHANYSDKVTEKTMADLCGMSCFQFSRTFKKVIGITFQNYLLNLRIDKAKELLMNPNAKIFDIAYTVGFTDASYFTRVFGRATGVSPSNYRQNDC